MTFVDDGRPDPDDKDTILDEMIAAAETAFGRDFTPDEVSVIRAFYDPIAEYCAQQQEDIASVLDSAQIDHAEGQALDLLAALIGVERREAGAATVPVQFRNDNPVGRDYTIPSGTKVQTDSSDPVSFTTDEAVELEFIDGFEDGDISEYGGDTSAFSVQTTTVYEGSNALEAPSSNSLIVNAGQDIGAGARFHVRENLNAGAQPGFLFAVQDQTNFYRVTLDEPGGDVLLEVVESGSASTINSASATIPTGSWVHLQVDWKQNGEYTVTLFDSSDSEIVSFDASETTATYESGGIGFSSEDTSATSYFDNATTSRVSVTATAEGSGAETNVGADTLVILADTVSGVDDVTNTIPATGGRDEEADDDFRVRAKDELSTGLRATLPALVTRLDELEVTRSVTVVDNDDNSTDAAGRPPHSFEAVVDADSADYEDVAEVILDTKAAGDTSVGGYAGSSVTRTLELINGQSKDITFSVPTQVTIYTDIDLTKTDEYAGDEQVQDNIVQYIGGTLNSGDNVDGEIGVGDNVIYNQVLEAVMDVRGVHDVTNLEVDTSSTPTGTSNISIADTETANADATDTSLDITSSDA